MNRTSIVSGNKTDHSELSSSCLEEGGGGARLPPMPQPPLVPSYRTRLFTVIILLLGVAASTAFLTIGIVASMAEAEEQFSHEAEELAHAVQLAMKEYELFGLWIHQACFKSAERRTDINRTADIEGFLGMCSRADFRDLYLHLVSREEFKFQSVQFLPKILHHERAELERQSRAYYSEHYPDYEYRGITDPKINADSGLLEFVARSEEPFYWPVHYVEPLETNEAAVELDAYADKQRAYYIDKVLESFTPSLSKGIRLVQETDPNALGIILRHPGIPNSNLAKEKPLFLSQVVIRVRDMLERATSGIVVPKTVYLYDSTENKIHPDFLGAIQIDVVDGETVRTDLPKTCLNEIDRPKASHMYVDEIMVADRIWMCAIVSGKDRPRVVYIVLGGVVIFCACVFLAFWFQTHMTRLAKFNELRARAEKEKSQIAQLQVHKEREINEYLSHEVRNPLSSAMSALSFVSSTVQDTKLCQISDTESRNNLHHDLGVMRASLQFINELLRNMLDIHRSAERQMKIDLKPTDILRDVLEPVASILFLRGASDSVEIRVECPDELVCQADRMRLKQIVVNLASNSVKFVEKGYICLRANVVNGQVEVSVEDSGPGIPESKRNRLFAKFQESLDELNQGTGIGLALCKNLSNLMSAHVRLDDSFHSGIDGCPGTRFVINLNQSPISVDHDTDEGRKKKDQAPLLHGTQSTTATPTEQSQDPLPQHWHVLFVDDDMILRRMFIRALKRTCPSWHIDEASNGETSLRLIETKRYDLIFMDQYMASVEKQLLGTETVRALRARGVDSIICGLSANDMEQQFVEAGANGFLFKPFPCETETLSAELIRILGTAPRLPSSTATTTTAAATTTHLDATSSLPIVVNHITDVSCGPFHAR